ncbi:MAG: putative molybdenum carrier protein [Flavobacterium sp.]|nr:putative molybdenum carrier protein [Flavobacterium sp.]
MKKELVLEAFWSGGQYGADLAGLVAGKILGFKTGGTAPKGYRVCNYDGSDGSNPDLKNYGLVEHSSKEYPPRTKQNVQDTDATLWVGYEHSRGGKLTIKTCKELGRDYIINPTSTELRNFVIEHQVKVLNVAGNRSSKENPDIYDRTYFLLIEAFGEIK